MSAILALSTLSNAVEPTSVTDPIATAVFGLLFERSGDAAFIVSRDTGCILSANPGAADLLEKKFLISFALTEALGILAFLVSAYLVFA